MNKLGPERPRAVLLFCAVACMGGGPILLKGHRILLGFWISVMFLFLIVGGAQLRKAKELGR